MTAVATAAAIRQRLSGLLLQQHDPKLQITITSSLEEAVPASRTDLPDCLMLAGPGVLDLLIQLRARVSADTLPAVVIGNDLTLERALRHGAQDALQLDGITAELLVRTIRHVCNEFMLLRQLSRFEDRLLPALAAGNIGVWDWDLTRDTAWFSDSNLTLHGRARGTPTPSFAEWLSWLHPDDAARLSQELPAALAGITMETEYRALWPDGTVRWLAARWRRVVEDGKPVRLTGASVDITARKRAEVELARSEERLRVTVESASVGTWAENLKTGEVIASAIARALHDIPQDTPLQSTSAISYVYPGDRARIADAIDDAARSDSSFSTEHRSLWHDGSLRWIHTSGRMATDPADGSRWLLGIVEDITAQKKGEERLARQEERLRLAQEAGGIGLYDWNPQTGKVYWSEQVERMFGLEPGSFESSFSAFLRLVHPDERDDIASRVQQAIAEKRERWGFDFRTLLPDGSIRWIGSLHRMYYDGAGLPVRGIGTNIDITEQVEARERLRKANQQLQQSQLRFITMAEAVPGVLFTSDSGGSCDYISKQFYEFTGMPAGSAEGFGWRDAIHPDDDGAKDAVWQAGVVTDRSFTHEFRMRRFDGVYRWFRGYAHAAHAGTGRPARWFGVLVDIEDERQARAALEEANREMEKFLSVVSHDLQVPIRTVETLSSWLRERHGSSLDRDAAQLVNFIETCARRMNGLVSTLLDYSRAGEPGAFQPVRVDCRTLVERTLRSMEASIRDSGVQVTVGDLPQVFADSTQMEQVFQNLLDNALKYRGNAQPRIEIAAEREGTNWIFRVADNGPGIPSPDLERVFLPFERLPAAMRQEGRGMGLAISRRIIEKHGGKIWVESSGSGSVFRFSFPSLEA